MIYMKKLVAISVLFAILTVAVFAQDDEGKWKFGFMAQHFSDLLWATSMSGKYERTSTAPGYTTQTGEYGKYNKGSINFFTQPDARPQPWNGKAFVPTPDNRLLLSISNSGENYDVYADIALDAWAEAFAYGGESVMALLSEGAADWYAKGVAGIFNAQIGTSGYGGWVNSFGTWNDFVGRDWNKLSRFGVWRANGGWLVGNDFRTWDEWGAVLAVGAALGDNYKLSLGYRLDPGFGDNNPKSHNNPAESYSSINASFMLNGRVSDAINFDLFYSIMGSDPNTFSRPLIDPAVTWLSQFSIAPAGGTSTAASNGNWNNILGAYIGLNVVENLGLSLGYTANFSVYETYGYVDTASGATAKDSKPVTFTAPFYSGIDIHMSFSGIENIGLTFNNNISLAGVKNTEKYDATKYTEKFILNFGGTPIINANDGESSSYDWFRWGTELKTTFALIDNVGLTLHLGNELAVTSDEIVTVPLTGITTTNTTKRTNNEFHAALTATYGIGAVTVGAGLFLGITSKAVENESVTTGTVSGTTTYKGNSDVVSFGIPIMFKVAF
jgi:hypothetical protein